MDWVAMGTTIVAGFLMSPFLVRHLGDSAYGVWILIGSLVGYLGLLDLGITQSIVKYIAEHRARGDQRAINRVVTGGIAFYSLMGLVSLGVSFAVAFRFNSIFNTGLHENTALKVAILAGLNLAVSFPATVYVGVLRGYQRYDVDSVVTSITIIVRSLILVALILGGHGLVALAIVTLVFDLSRLAILIFWVYRINPEITISRAYLNKQEMKRLFTYSVFAFLIIIGKRMIFYTDSIVIGIFQPAWAVTHYFVGSRLVTYLLQASEAVGVLTPTTSDLDARNDRQSIRELLVLSTKYLLLVTLPLGAIFLVMGETFISLWMGPEFRASASILTILTIAALAHLIELPPSIILLGIGRHRIVAWFTLAQALVNLGLSIFFVQHYEVVRAVLGGSVPEKLMPLAGVALGTAIPMIVFPVVEIVVYFRKYLDLALGSYLWRAVPLPILIQAPFVALLLLIRRYWPPTSLVVFFALIAAALIPYALLAFRVAMSPTERRVFLGIAERLGLKLSPVFPEVAGDR